MDEGVDDGSGLGNVGAGREPLGVGTAAVLPVHAVIAMSNVRLNARRWVMEIRPERGGRITSLRLDGDELLDQGIGVDQPTAQGFVEGGAFGWDEMVPNLEPTATLPDHGEAWRLPWEVLGAGIMRCTGRMSPWQLERRISLEESVEVNYVYTNVGERPHAAYWCAHPLLRYEADMAIPVEAPRPAEGGSAKVSLPSGAVDHVRLGRVVFRWDSLLAPDVAIWICNGDLGGYRQIAVEPSWTKPDLAPGRSYSWWLRIDPL